MRIARVIQQALRITLQILCLVQISHMANIQSECQTLNNQFYSKSLIKSGYLTVSKKNNSALFFTFQGKKNIKDERNLPNFPILIYLSGGPGCSSQFCDFCPTYVNNVSGKLIEIENKNTWNSLVNLLLIDHPIGTGGSIAASQADIPCNESQVTEHLYYALQQFQKLDFGKQFINSKVQLFGISYGGKYVPNLAKKILDENTKGAQNYINVIGLGIANGWTDPVGMSMEQGTLGYYYGFLDIIDQMSIEKLLIKIGVLAKKGGNENLSAATELSVAVNDIIMEKVDIFNQRQGPEEYWEETFNNEQLNTPSIHEVYHLKQKFIDWNKEVGDKFTYDQMQNDYVTLEYVLNNSDINVLIYQGTDDAMVPNAGTLGMVEKMQQNSNENSNMKNSDFDIWRLKNQTIVGYFKKSGKLEIRMVLKAGHCVEGDQPEVAYELFENFFNNTNP